MKYYYPFLFTLAYFLLPLIHMAFAFLALACLALPFLLPLGGRGRVWCHRLCPRADFLSKLKFLSRRRIPPKWLTGDRARQSLLTYFGINLFFITLSTLMVTVGGIAPIDRVRLLIVFPLPWSLPQLIPSPVLPAPLLHLAYRFYSLMLTSTLLGTVLALLYRPRSWCAVCPVGTLSKGVAKK